MSGRAWWEVPAHVAAADERLVEAFEAAIGEGERRAGRHLACRLGCTACCIGPFDITALDATRLARGLVLLRRDDPAAAFAVRDRALSQWREMAAQFPGEASEANLAQDDARRVEFFDAFADVPCPALDPATGACALYVWRPLSCRSLGLPVRCRSQTLAPSTLNFTAATGGGEGGSSRPAGPRQPRGRSARRSDPLRDTRRRDHRVCRSRTDTQFVDPNKRSEVNDFPAH
jgi:Fe-S-cluster containining protein